MNKGKLLGGLLLAACSACSTTTQGAVTLGVSYEKKIGISSGCADPSVLADSVLRALEFEVVSREPTKVVTEMRTGANRSHVKLGLLDRLGSASTTGLAPRSAIKVTLFFEVPEKPRSAEHVTDIGYEIITRYPEGGRVKEEVTSTSKGAIKYSPMYKRPTMFEIYDPDIRTLFSTLVEGCGAA